MFCHFTVFKFTNFLINKFIDGLQCGQARQTRPNSGGVAEGHPRFDKGGVAIIFTFYALKI